MKFSYQARNKDGDIQAGQVEASSREAAVGLLQKHGLYITLLEEEKPPIYAIKLSFFENVSRKEVVLFSRQLSIMFLSKISLIEALKVLGSQIQNSDFKEKIFKISEEVEGGTSFSKAISAYPKIFSSFYVAMVKSGEASGKLAEVLSYLADHLEREYHLVSKAKGAMVYPSLILLVVVLVLIMMVYFILPNLTQVLESSGQDLPFVTKAVLAFAGFIRKAGWLVLLLVALGGFFLYRFSKKEKGKEIMDKYILKMPLAGNLIKMISIARFSENLSTLISGSLPIAQSLEITGEIIGNTSYKEVILKARDEVRKGEPISSVLFKSPELFPPVFTQMVLVGERTGTLDTTLINIVSFYQKEIDRAIDSVLSILEPALIVFLGVIVGGMLLSVLMPLYKMMGGV